MTGPRRPGLTTFGSLRKTRGGHYFVSLTLLLILSASRAQSHDPSAWGGLFRSRDYGATWMSANPAGFVSGAIALAISPTDVNHLLLGAESGLLRSRNGGRDWTIEAPSVVLGSVFAVAFAADGRRTLISTGQGIFRDEGQNSWREVPTPQGAAPARAILRSKEPDRIYLAGWAGLYRSDDWGASWSSAADNLPQEPATALVVVSGSPEILFAIVQGQIWSSDDGARSWMRRGGGISPASADSLTADLRDPARLWAAGSDRLFRSNDGGANWRPVGRPLPEPNTSVNGITGSGEWVVITTDRGLYRSVDSGENWSQVIDNLPAHLEAGPLVRDPVDPATLYAGFSLIPYPELWRRAADLEGAFARFSVTSLAGGAVFLVLVALAALAALRWLRQYYRPSASAPAAAQTSKKRGMEKTLS